MNADVQFSSVALDGVNGNVTVVALFGQLDEATSDVTFQKVHEYVDSHADEKYFIFDLRELEYLNSKSIGYVIDFYRKLNERGGSIVLSRAGENVLDILDLVGVTRVIQHTYSIDEAKLAILDIIKDNG